jgi:hypothetical protein
MPRSRAAACRRALALIAALVVLGSCRIDATVAVTVEEDGTGVIELTVVADADVVREAPDLAADLRLEDVTAAGWTAVGPEATADGGLQLVLSHDFASTGEATALLGQLSGANGPFVGLELVQDRSFARLTTALTGSISLAEGVATMADDVLVEQVGSAPYLAALTEREISIADAFGLRLVVTTPGSIVETDGAASPPVGATTTVSWEADLLGAAASRDGQPTTMRAALIDEDARQASRIRDFAPWALAAWVVFVLGVVLPTVALVRRQRRRR